jgi:Family of unknown function (DUF6535)
MSLTCALLATLLQQWARRYIRITQPPRYSPHKRAPIRAFFADGVEKYHLPSSVEALPALLHISLFLFFLGLIIFLFNIHHTVFSVVVWWVGLATAVYIWITVMPIFRHDSPYYAPLSSSVWLFHTGIIYTVAKVRCSLWMRLFQTYWGHWYDVRTTYRRRFSGGITKSVQEIGSELSVEINNRILTWTLNALDEDHELEQFFASIPGFCSSTVVRNTERVFTELDPSLRGAFYGFLDRTLSSSLLLEADKERRVIMCVKAADKAHLSAARNIFNNVFTIGVDVILQSVDIGRTLSLKSRGDSGDQDILVYVHKG